MELETKLHMEWKKYVPLVSFSEAMNRRRGTRVYASRKRMQTFRARTMIRGHGKREVLHVKPKTFFTIAVRKHYGNMQRTQNRVCQ